MFDDKSPHRADLCAFISSRGRLLFFGQLLVYYADESASSSFNSPINKTDTRMCGNVFPLYRRASTAHNAERIMVIYWRDYTLKGPLMPVVVNINFILLKQQPRSYSS